MTPSNKAKAGKGYDHGFLLYVSDLLSARAFDVKKTALQRLLCVTSEPAKHFFLLYQRTVQFFSTWRSQKNILSTQIMFLLKCVYV